MSFTTVGEWVAWAGLVLPLATISWAALQFVLQRRRDLKQQNFDNFFLTLERVHNADGCLIAQKGAIFELRNYPEYKDVILRICDDAPTLFAPNFDPRIAAEFLETAKYLRGR